MSERFDLAMAWDWEYDADFLSILESAVHREGRRFYSITHHNTEETLQKLRNGELAFRFFLDRASSSDEKFLPILHHLQASDAKVINPPEVILHAIDKATMHLEFLTKGIEVPFTIIISPYNKRKELELSLSDLAHLGRPFIIKPANTTGGGIGVILGAESLKDVIDSRQHHKNDKYLLQEKIKPVLLGEMKAWFRIFCVFGEIVPCWWDDETHVYEILTPADEANHELGYLREIVEKIWDVCKMDFFSTEIALTAEGRFVTVDYVNDICDMRLQSGHHDGVPDSVVAKICMQIAKHLDRVPNDESAQGMR